MSKIDISGSKKLTKKEVRQVVYEKLSRALTEFKPNFKEKKFESNLKKASKLFASDLAKSIGKKVPAAKPKKAKTKEVKEELAPTVEQAQ